MRHTTATSVDHRLPLTVEELTPAWFTEVLALPGGVVEAVTIDSIIWGTATKVFVRLSYAEPAEGLAMQPEAVCGAMGERYAVACDDHKVFEALGV